jgi:hypothetical protein
VVFLAIYLDRLTQALGARKRRPRRKTGKHAIAETATTDQPALASS